MNYMLSIKMRYLIEPRDIYVKYMWKDIDFLSFTKKLGTHLSNKYSQKVFDTAKNSTTDTIKTASKRAIQKTAEATVDLIGNKIADKITSVSKTSTKELPNDETEGDVEKVTTTIRKRYISPKERQQIIDGLRLV